MCARDVKELIWYIPWKGNRLKLSRLCQFRIQSILLNNPVK